MTAELRAWLMSGADQAEPDPILYVAFGTLVALDESIANRLITALEDGPWRVLWSMPEVQQQSLIPERLRKGNGKWRMETFVPQADVLSFIGVKGFLSHCGQNSTQE